MARPKNWPTWRSRRRPSPEDEAEIRLRLPAHTKHSTQRRAEENRRALQLTGISEVTRARHLAWLAYNMVFKIKAGNVARQPTRLPRPRQPPVISRPDHGRRHPRFARAR